MVPVHSRLVHSTNRCFTIAISELSTGVPRAGPRAGVARRRALSRGAGAAALAGYRSFPYFYSNLLQDDNFTQFATYFKYYLSTIYGTCTLLSRVRKAKAWGVPPNYFVLE